MVTISGHGTSTITLPPPPPGGSCGGVLLADGGPLGVPLAESSIFSGTSTVISSVYVLSLFNIFVVILEPNSGFLVVCITSVVSTEKL